MMFNLSNIIKAIKCLILVFNHTQPESNAPINTFQNTSNDTSLNATLNTSLNTFMELQINNHSFYNDLIYENPITLANWTNMSNKTKNYDNEDYIYDLFGFKVSPFYYNDCVNKTEADNAILDIENDIYKKYMLENNIIEITCESLFRKVDRIFDHQYTLCLNTQEAASSYLKYLNEIYTIAQRIYDDFICEKFEESFCYEIIEWMAIMDALCICAKQLQNGVRDSLFYEKMNCCGNEAQNIMQQILKKYKYRKPYVLGQDFYEYCTHEAIKKSLKSQDKKISKNKIVSGSVNKTEVL